MKKPFLASLLVVTFVLLTIVFAACGDSAAGSNDPNAVHMNDANFVQASVTISKGDKLTIVNDSSQVHILANGYWDSNGTPKPVKEDGAATVEANFNAGSGETQQFGPFNIAGTFHIYCSVHPNMNLTIKVK